METYRTSRMFNIAEVFYPLYTERVMEREREGGVWDETRGE
jgi:hypothetical protein